MELQAVDEHRSLAEEDFRRNYLIPQRPVVIRGALASWPAVINWTPQYLREAVGDHLIEVLSKSDYGNQGSKRHLERHARVAFTEFLDVVYGDDPPDLSYARQSSIWLDIARLRADVGDIGFDLRIVKEEGFLWLGPKDTVAQLHWDPGRNLVAQIRGEKSWILVSPEDSALTYPNKFSLTDALRACQAPATDGKAADAPASGDIRNFIESCLSHETRDMLFHYLGSVNNCEVNAEAPDPQANTLYLRAKRYRTTVGPGDLLFVPLCWRHYVRSLSPSISMNWFFHQDHKIPQSLIDRTLAEHLVL